MDTTSGRYDKGAAESQPAPLTKDWWDCMAFEKMRNYDAIHRRHVTEAARIPADLSMLPSFTAPSINLSNQCRDYGAGDASDSGSNASRGAGNDPETELFLESAPTFQRATGKAEPLSKHCGSLPVGSRLEEFHEPPLKLSARNAEGRYWQDFAAHVREALPHTNVSTVIANSSSRWHIREVDAL